MNIPEFLTTDSATVAETREINYLPPNSPFPMTWCSLTSFLFMDQPPVVGSEDKRHTSNFSVEGFASHINRTAAMMHRVRSQSGAHSGRTRPERPPFPPPALALLVWCTGRPHPWCSAEKNRNNSTNWAAGAARVAQLYMFYCLYISWEESFGGKSEKQQTLWRYFRPRDSSGLSPSEKSPVNPGGSTLGLRVDFFFHFCISSHLF